MIGVIPAAGVGSRMAAEIPKQYFRVADYTLLEHSCQRLLADTRIEHVYIALSPEDNWFSETSLYRNSKVTRVTGGASRAESVLNCLASAEKEHTSATLAVVHDAARPCLPATCLARLLDAAENHPGQGAILAMPARDTMKRSLQFENTHVITETVEREYLWHAMTPQVFQLGQLKTALESALGKNMNITDEASAMEQSGVRPLLVAGDHRAMKLTEPGDFPFIQWLLSKGDQANNR